MSAPYAVRRGGVVSPKKDWSPSSPIIQHSLTPPARRRRDPLTIPVNKRNVAAAVFVLIVLSSFSLINVGHGTMKASITYNVHSPIVIDSNTDFQTTALAEGWAGDGTMLSPYEIRDLEIDALGVLNGIYIGNVTLYFSVANCHLINALEAGLSLHNTSHGLIVNNTCELNSYGIRSVLSSNNTIDENTCSGNSLEGIYVTNSHWTGVSNNSCNSNTADGILVDSSFDFGVEGARCQGNGNGVTISSCSHFSVNDSICSSNINIGILFINSDNGIVGNNTCDHDDEGIMVDTCSMIYLVNNSGHGNYDGMNIIHCSNVLVAGGTMTGNTDGFYIRLSSQVYLDHVNASLNFWDGVYFYSCTDCTVQSGIFASNVGNGIELTGGASNSNIFLGNQFSHNQGTGLTINTPNNEVSGNEFLENGGYGVSLLSSASSNTVWNNNFSSNNGAGTVYDPSKIQASDSGSNNRWNLSGTPHGLGNYWEDWATTDDKNKDGILDTPYLIDGSAGSYDYYPLAGPALEIPEFGLLLPVLISMIGIVFAASARRRGKQ